MLDTLTDMRVEAVAMAAEAKQLRREIRKANRSVVRSMLHQNSEGTQYHQRRLGSLERERLNTRKLARLHHLSRMMLKNKPYLQVENTAINKVDPLELYETVWEWAPNYSFEDVNDWLSYGT